MSRDPNSRPGPPANWTYSYDQFNRLVGSNQNSGAQIYSYVYDRFGNRWQQNGPVTFSATFTGNNPANPANNNRIDTASGYTYDAAGNVHIAGLYTYTYDAENRLTAVTGNGTNATYTYDALGRRVARTGDTSSNVCGHDGIFYYLYNLEDRWTAALNSGGGSCDYELVYAGNRHIATYAGGTVFPHADWLGTERLRVNYTYVANRGTDEKCTSLPFGDGLNCGTGGDPSPLHFTGKERDSESGLDNFDFRYYGSSLGRFMKPDDTDPEEHVGNPQGLNLYSYVQNNPTNSTDPDGHDCVYINDNSASVTRGDCKSDTDNGIFVNGTIDTKSGSYDSSTGTLSFNYTNDDTGAIGKGVIGDVYPSGGGGGIGTEAGAVAIFSDLNRRNILNNTLKIAGAGALIGATGGAACYYLCPAATVTTLGIAASPLLPVVPSAIQKLQQIGVSVQEATAIVESPTTQKVIDNLNSGNINHYAEVGGKLVRITTNPEGTRIISAGFARANQITNGIANGRFLPK